MIHKYQLNAFGMKLGRVKSFYGQPPPMVMEIAYRLTNYDHVLMTINEASPTTSSTITRIAKFQKVGVLTRKYGLLHVYKLFDL